MERERERGIGTRIRIRQTERNMKRERGIEMKTEGKRRGKSK